MCQTLRSVDGGASAFVDSTTPASQKLILTHIDGWLTCFGLVRVIDSNTMCPICHRNHSDQHTNLHTGLFISLCKRTRARLIPKNQDHEPGSLSIHAGFITTITKSKTHLCNCKGSTRSTSFKTLKKATCAYTAVMSHPFFMNSKRPLHLVVL